MTSNETNTKSKRIAKNTLFLYFRQFLIMAVAIYTSRIVLQALGVVDYGVYNVVGGMVAMFSFLNSSLAQATQRFIAFGIEKDNIEDQRNTFSMLLNVHGLIAVLLFLLCETIGLWLFYNKLVIPDDRMDSAFWVMQCSILTLMISVTQVPYNASIFGHERMNAYAYISIIEVLLKLGAVILLQYFFNDKLLAYGIMLMCVQTCIAMIYRFYCLRQFKNCNYRLYWSNQMFRQIFSFSSWSLIGNLAFTLNNQGMNFLINIFFGPVYNAAKGIATAVESAVSTFVTNFLGASIPQIIKSYATGDLEYCFKLNIKSSKFGFFLFMLISLPLISIINPILSLWLTDVPPQADIFCVLSLFYIQANTLGGTLQNLVQATGKIRYYQLSNGFLKLCALPTVYILYKIGTSVNTYLYVLILFSILGLFLQLAAVKKTVREYSTKTFIKAATIPELTAYGIPCLVSLFFLGKEQTLVTAIWFCSCTFLICLMSIWIIGLTRNEKKWIISIIKSKYNRK